MWRRVVVGAGLVAGTALAVAGVVVYREFTATLPPVESLLKYQLPVATRVYADDGTLLGEFYTEKRYLVPIGRIPPVVRQAFIAAEDASFYRHKGVDLQGIVRAAVANFTTGRVVQGGSTITQQVVKALLLSPERSYERKLKEILLAIRLERQLSKDEILYLYLNLIYLGNGAYGVGAAAQEYFGKEVQDLTLAEAALLAGLPQAPSRYSPVRHWDRAKFRQRYVLERMARERFVTWDEAETALQQPLGLVRHEATTPVYAAAPYFVEHVRRLLEERYGGIAPYQAGLNVYTTVDLRMQTAAEEALRKHLDEVDEGRTRARAIRRLSEREAQQFIQRAKTSRDDEPPFPGRSYRALVLGPAPKGKAGFEVQVNRFTGILHSTPEHALPKGLAKHDLIAVRRLPGSNEAPEFQVDGDPQLEGAIVSIELATGYVRALVGGYDYYRSQFNRATQAVRQPGSAFKPFIFAAALDRGYTPASVINDGPIYLPAGNGRIWSPKNYDEKYLGPISLRMALAKSRNVVTVKLAQSIGLNYVIDYLKRFGFGRKFAKNLSLALGTAEVTPLELTRAYTVFPNQGRRLEPLFITKITDPHGRVLEEFAPRSESVISPETAYLVTSMMESVVKRGTGKRVKDLGRPVAGKTGTTNDIHDAWFLGFTPELATGVWIGYDSERSLGKEQTGGKVAAPIFLSYMQAALADAPVTDFPIPDGIACNTVDGGEDVECFKKGLEERRQEAYNPFRDDLDRAVGRLRQNVRDGAPSNDDTAEESPSDDGLLDGTLDVPDDWPAAAKAATARKIGSGALDTREPPRAEDYLEPRDREGRAKYEDGDRRRDRRRGWDEDARYMERRDRIVEEPLVY